MPDNNRRDIHMDDQKADEKADDPKTDKAEIDMTRLARDVMADAGAAMYAAARLYALAYERDARGQEEGRASLGHFAVDLTAAADRFREAHDRWLETRQA